MDGCGLTTGSTMLDALLLALIPVLTVLLQRAGLGWLLDRKPQTPAPTEPSPVATAKLHADAADGMRYVSQLPGQTVGFFDFMVLFWPLIEQLIKQALDLLSKRLGREPTPQEREAEVQKVLERIRRGRVRIPAVAMVADDLNDGDLEQVTGGKDRLRSTLDGIDATVRDIGQAARSGRQAFDSVNGMFRPATYARRR